MTVRGMGAGFGLLVALVLTGCGLAEGGRNCTLMGGVPGVTVHYAPGPTGSAAVGATAADPVGPAVFRLCVDGKCDERTESSAAADTRMYVRMPDDVRDRELDVRVSVTSVEGGRVIMRDSAKVRMTEYWPNGKACDDEGTWAVTLKAEPGRGLVGDR